MTAAHCILSLKPSDYQVLLGYNDLNQPQQYSISRTVSRIVVHEAYVDRAFYNDIVFLFKIYFLKCCFFLFLIVHF